MGPGLAHSGLIPSDDADAGTRANSTQSEGKIIDFAQSSNEATSITSETAFTGCSLIRERLKRDGLSLGMSDIVLASWRLGTTKQYSVYLKKWRNYCDKENLDCLNPGIIPAIEFLGILHKQGLVYSAVNTTALSALSSILPFENGIIFGDHPLVCRALKGIFELKPALPKYSHIWDVSIVLEYLKVLGYPTAMNLKQLTLKLTMLVCLLTGQRCQTAHCMDVQYRVTIQQKFKQTKAGKYLHPIDLKAFADDPRICIVQHLEEYLKCTAQLRAIISNY